MSAEVGNSLISHTWKSGGVGVRSVEFVILWFRMYISDHSMVRRVLGAEIQNRERHIGFSNPVIRTNSLIL